MSKLSRWSTLVLGSALAVAPALQARTCTGNGDLIGAYAWYGSRTPQFVSTPANRTAAPIRGSATPIGALTAGAQNSATFAAVGRIYFDGAGGIFASANAGEPVLQVGSYVSNSDCTVTATITDTFTLPIDPFIPPIQASAKFEGVIVQGNNEVDLVQTSGTKGTTLVWSKVKLYNGCGPEAIIGTFGFAATGQTTASLLVDGSDTPEVTVTPFNLSGRLASDGAGTFVQDTQALESPLATQQYTGSYTINADCTGKATLTDSTGKSRKISFVVVGSGTGSQATLGLQFAFADSNVSGAGLAQQQ